MNPQMEYRFSTQSITTSEFRICAKLYLKHFFWVRSINIASLTSFRKQQNAEGGCWWWDGDFFPQVFQANLFHKPLTSGVEKVEPLHGCQVAERMLSIKTLHLNWHAGSLSNKSPPLSFRFTVSPNARTAAETLSPLSLSLSPLLKPW